MKNLIFLSLFLFGCSLVSAQGEDIYLPRANDCFEKGDYECAKRYYMFFQTKAGKDMSAQIQLAEECFRNLNIADNYFLNKEYEKAKEQCKAVLDKNPKDPYAKKLYDLCRGQVLPRSDNYIETQDPLPSSVNIEMIFVQGGTFTMGCTSEQGRGCFDGEKPSHRVTLSDFFIGKYEVTQAQWRVIMGNNPSYFKGDNLPVEWVSWNDVQLFIRKLNAHTGMQYRLPTEAEWEFAARGGNMSNGYKYSGSNNVGSVAWYTDNSGNKTHPVGTKAPNELGIYDMSGNVWEWCSDWYDSYSTNAQTNPQGASIGSYRVNRGGSWYGNAWLSRISLRNFYTTDFRDNSRGFRLAYSSK